MKKSGGRLEKLPVHRDWGYEKDMAVVRILVPFISDVPERTIIVNTRNLVNVEQLRLSK